MHPLGHTMRAGGREDEADVHVAFAKKDGAAAGDGKK